MKKVVILLLAVCMLVAILAGCGNKPTSDAANPSQETSTGKEETSNSTTESTQATDAEETTVPDQESATTPSEENNTDPTEKPTETVDPTEETKPVHTHAYSAATCTQPKKCACGATDGSALGHSYSNATCTAAKKCSRCGATDGNALGHTWTAATCTAPKTCSTCKATEGSAADHTWKNATCIAPKTCTKCGATEGLLATHIFENGKCIFCQKDDIIELNLNLLQNETYVSYELIGNNELIEYTINFDLVENNAIIFGTGEYYYYAEPDFDTTNARSVKYDGKDFYGGDGGFGGYWLVAKENTLEVFDEWNAWLYTDSQSVATYAMQHDGKLRLVESKVNYFPSLYENKG